MSKIAGSHLFLLRDFTPDDSSVIERLIKSLTDEIRVTRKGRHWEAYIRDQEVGLTIHVYRTDEVLCDCEDDLMEMDMLLEDAPECISILTNLGTENDLKACEALTLLISEELKCRTLGANLHS